MVDHELAARGLDDPSPVGGGVVRLALAEGDTLGHSAGEGTGLVRVRGCVSGVWQGDGSDDGAGQAGRQARRRAGSLAWL